MRIRLTEQQVNNLINNQGGNTDDATDIEKMAPTLTKMWKSLADADNPLDNTEKNYNTAQNTSGNKNTTNIPTDPNAQFGPNVSPGNDMYHPLGHAVAINSYYGARNQPYDPVSGKQGSSYHQGVDLQAPQGSKVYAPLDGTISIVKYNDGSCGNHLEIDHAALITKFCHLSGFEVKVGQKVKKGQFVALSGGDPRTQGSGTTTGPHLHYEILHKDRTPYDPMKVEPNLKS